MPGDYLFPKRRFRHAEPLESDEINEAIQPPAERLNGNLGPHNLRAPLPSSVAAQLDTFARTRVSFVDVDSGLADQVSSPKPGGSGVFTLQQQTSWQMVSGSREGDDMQIDLSTGESTLSMTAMASFCFAGEDDGLREVWSLDGVLPISGSYEDFYDDFGPRATVRVFLDSSGPSVYYEFDITLPTPGRTNDATAKKIARRIASGGRESNPPGEDFSDPVTGGGSGWTARAEGRSVLFTRRQSGASGGGTFKMVLVGGLAAGSTMTRQENATVSPTAQALSDLASHSTTGGDYLIYYVAQLQFALRVDGVVIPETITGRLDDEQGSFQPARRERPINNSTGEPVGVMGVRFRERPDGIGIPMYTVRLTYDVAVSPGTHRVELVARRVPMDDRRAFRLPVPAVGTMPTNRRVMPANNEVCIYNRQLRVTEVPEEPSDAAYFDDVVSVPDFDYEDVVSHETLDDERLRLVVDAHNEIEDYRIARGAVNNAHLGDLQTTIAVAQASLNSGSVTIAAGLGDLYSYPTVGAVTFGNSMFLYPMPAGWKLVVEAPFNRTVPTGPCVISVEGNVFLDRMRTIAGTTNSSTATVPEEMHLAAGVFVVGVKYNGSWYMWRPSIAWVNSNLYWASQSALGALDTIAHLSAYEDNNGQDYFDVPVTAEMPFYLGDAIGLGLEITDVAIFGSVCRMNATVGAQARVKAASIGAIVVKP